MASPERAEGFSPELRASLYHFTVFASTGAGSAYYAIWMSGRGLSSGEIGIVNAVPVLIMLGLNLFIGRLADKASDWKVTIVILSLIAGVAPIGYFFVNDFWGLLLIFTLCAVPAGAVVPVIDAATLRMTQRRGTDFGFVRAWGTVGYTVTSAATGVIVRLARGGGVCADVHRAIAAARWCWRFRCRSSGRRQRSMRRRGSAAAQSCASLMQPWFLLPCVCASR